MHECKNFLLLPVFELDPSPLQEFLSREENEDFSSLVISINKSVTGIVL
jgi:hypothetical protein